MNRLKEVSIKRLHPYKRRFLGEAIVDLRFGRSGDLAAMTAEGEVFVLDPSNLDHGKKVWQHENGGLSVVWSANGEFLASSGHDGYVKIGHRPEMQNYREIRVSPKWCENLTWIDGGKYLVSCGKTLFQVDYENRTFMECETFSSTITGISRLSPDEVVLSTNGKAVRFTLSERKVITYFDFPEAMLNIKMAPKGTNAAIGFQDAAARVWNINQSNDALQMSGYHEKIRLLDWSHDGSRLAVFAGALTSVWNFSGLGPEGGMSTELIGCQSRINSAQFAPSSAHLAAADSSGILCIWDCDRNEEMPLAAAFNKSSIESLAWHIHGDRIATGDLDGSIAVYQLGFL